MNHAPIVNLSLSTVMIPLEVLSIDALLFTLFVPVTDVQQLSPL